MSKVLSRIAIITLVAFIPIWETAKAQQANPTQAAVACTSFRGDINSFAACWISEMMSDRQQQVARCFSESKSVLTFAFCSAQRPLSPQEQQLADCALRLNGDYGAAAACAGMQFLGPEEQRLVRCVVSNGANYLGAAICAGGRNLTPEQTVVANCALTTGAQPYAFAGCVGGPLTENELQKCVTIGIGANGCFGNNNTIVRAVSDAWQGISGSNSVFNNPGQILGGQNSIINDLRLPALPLPGGPTIPPPPLR